MIEAVSPGIHPNGGITLKFNMRSSVQLKSPDWKIAGRELCFLYLPPNTRYSLVGERQFVKVIAGRLDHPGRGCFAQPFEVRSTLVDSDHLVASSDGALVALLKETDLTPMAIRSMKDARFFGVLDEQLVWRSFESRFSQVTDFFNGLDCHMMDGIHLLDEHGETIVYVNFWACGIGIDLSTHNHSHAPREGAPAFAEVHWVIEAGSASSGMYRTPEPGHAERSTSPMKRGDEHGPYFDFSEQTRLPRLRDNGAVIYGWHGWQSGDAASTSGEQAYDLVAAFEISPRFARV